MTLKICVRTLVWLLVLLIAVPQGVFSQPSEIPPPPQGETSPPPLFRQEELDQMLAPIALYPDSLLVQVFMAATYPIEIVEANRWLGANRQLQGDAFATALDQQPWDPSVKSLANFPSVLAMMDQRLDWTQRLGDAFLSQKDQVMDTVQKLRAAAQAQGTLTNTAQQRVITEGPAIVIEPVEPQVVYVPVYDPMVVYGPWWYPDYPPYPYYPVGAVIVGGIISFGIGVALGAAWGWAWGGFGWRHHHVGLNVYQNVGFNHRINRNVYVNRYGGGGRGAWHHDAVHRRGVAYRDMGTAQRYGQGPRGVPGHTADFRGRPSAPGRPGAPGVSGRNAQIQSERGRQSREAVTSPRTGMSPGRPSGTGRMGQPGQPGMSRPPAGAARPGGPGMSRPPGMGGGGGGAVGRPPGGGGGGMGRAPGGGGGGGRPAGSGGSPAGGGGGHSGGGHVGGGGGGGHR
ncbi:MAG TPA: DUF3300 domain-containing protein [Syntrophorhabdaceae bacterium]